MINKKTKHKLIQELQKSGNVYLSCLKLGIDKATYYRWREKNKKFKEIADKAVAQGRENNCDVAEHALMLRVKEKDMGAIKYVLSNNSEIYKPKRSSYALIEHRKPIFIEPVKKTYTDLLYEEAEEKLKEDLKSEFANKEIPNKPNGDPIPPDEFLNYEKYIRDTIKYKEQLEERKRLTDESSDSPEAHPASS